MSFGKILRDLRGDKTQEEIAQAVGVTKSSWAMYEREERIPRDEVKIQIAKYFGKSVQDIFLGRVSTKCARQKKTIPLNHHRKTERSPLCLNTTVTYQAGSGSLV